ncbi:MAG TPA: Mur ligase family protein [Candidatus Saccharimonadales bacterium]|nr:Mur ligase family protein [Candidatus Saccharimonadales bacterium]
MSAGKLHFLGIAGSTMAGIAQAVAGLGYEVSGTDVGAYPPASDWLDAQGIQWWREESADHLEGVDTVIISGGTAPDDLELVAARVRNIPIKSYAEFIGELVADKRQIVVAGTHGKTTTTSLIAWLLEAAGRHPDFLIGIQPHNFDASVRLSDSPVMVLEGDEYKASAIDERSKLSYYRPSVLVATSLELDHPDLFKSVGEIGQRLAAVAAGMSADSQLLYAADAAELSALAAAAAGGHESYGEDGDWQATGLRFEPTGIAFEVQHQGKHLGHFAAPLYGRHNIYNVLAAIAVAHGEGLAAAEIQDGLARFSGAARRFQVVSAPDATVTVIDDYAHHPTEIATTIEAARLHFNRRVIAVVRPHTYSRVKELLPQYQSAVRVADLAFVTDIEGAREKAATPAISGQDIIDGGGDQVVYEPDRQRLVQRLTETVRPGDIVLCMTVSGYDCLAAQLAAQLKPQ